MQGERAAIALFATAPVSGKVKTRLAPLVDGDEAARLHTAFVADTLEMLGSLAGLAEIELSTDTETDAWRGFAVTRTLQSEGDIGERMLGAIERLLAAGRRPVVILGSDSPTLPASHVLHLLRTKADVAFGPTEEGAFYAVACRRSSPRMFQDVVWSSPFALETALDAARRCELTVEIGPRWFDVNNPRDLDRLRACRHIPRHTAGWFESWAG